MLNNNDTGGIEKKGRATNMPMYLCVREKSMGKRQCMFERRSDTCKSDNRKVHVGNDDAQSQLLRNSHMRCNNISCLLTPNRKPNLRYKKRNSDSYHHRRPDKMKKRRKLQVATDTSIKAI